MGSHEHHHGLEQKSIAFESQNGVLLIPQEYYEYIPSSTVSWQDILEVITFPDALKGLKILDVGSGASDMVSRLIKIGVEAYGIDPAYTDTKQLDELIKDQLNSGSYNSQDRSLRHGSWQTFKRSFKRHPDRYLSASAEQLPFKDDIFDMVYSFNTITAYLDADEGFFERCLVESLRVLKPGRSLVVYPFGSSMHTFPEALNQQRLKNNQVVVNRLQHKGVIKELKFGVETERDSKSLIMIKPSH